MQSKRIFLIGFMGSGKTTYAKRLAKELGYTAYDLDLEIEIRLQQKVEAIFNQHGENFFRLHERIELHKTEKLENVVVSVGGGTPCFYDNMDWMRANGLCIYLEMSSKALTSRLKNAKRKRPLIEKLNEEELLQFILKKLEERAPYYQKAHHTVQGIGLKPKALIEALDLQP